MYFIVICITCYRYYSLLIQCIYILQNATEEIKQMVGFISQLKNEIVTNKALTILPIIENDSDNDAAVWNKYLEDKTEKEGATPTWFNTEWLYCECYMYRRLAQKFLLM